MPACGASPANPAGPRCLEPAYPSFATQKPEDQALDAGRSDPGRPVVQALQALLVHNALDRSHFLRSDGEAVAQLKAQSLPPPDGLAAQLAAKLASLANAFVRSDGKKWRRACLR